jgi:uncharacterized protein YbjT (DUF2867 family)
MNTISHKLRRSNMKVLVIGATGATGGEIVKQLVEQGHTVTAFARTPSKVSTYDGKVRVVQGDAHDQASLEKALVGQDAVLSALGPRSLKKDDLQEAFARNLVSSMQMANVSRLVELSAIGAGDSAQQASFPIIVIRKTVLKNMFDDKERGEQLILDSQLNYTLVRPGRLMNGPAKGGVKASLSGKEVSMSMHRADVAQFMIDQLEDNTWVRKAPLIGY